MAGVKLELTWWGKGVLSRPEPRILLHDSSRSYHALHRVTEDDEFRNILIHGDNLLSLKALEQEYENGVQCVYIDPPYNTGSAFTHYDDSLEHSTWLSMMHERLLILQKLLRPEGVLFVSIDEDEGFYLKVLLDEVFLRKNYCGHFVWEKKKKPSFLNSNMGSVTEFILCYAKDRTQSPPFVYGTTTEGKKYPLNNAGNALKTLTFPPGSVRFKCEDQRFEPQDMSDGNIRTRLVNAFTVHQGVNREAFQLEGEWRYSQNTLNEILAAGEQIVISKAPFRPNHIKTGGEPKKLKNLLSTAHYGMSTYEDATEESRQLFGTEHAFDYPKPEMLLATLIGAVTEPGDIVLDSFAGSGTTGAVAHKMGRRWIMVELGEHCHTHIIPRMKNVIDGEDPGGITNDVDWRGGGGYRYYKLAPTLIQKDKYGNDVINPEYNVEMLAEAMCKHMGFRYAPSEEVYWMHGQSTERDYIYVTTQPLTPAHLQYLNEDVGPDRSLLICCTAFRGSAEGYPNLTIKKIPKAVLGRCEFGRDDYSLEIQDLPFREDSAEEPSRNGKTRKKVQTPDLFAEEAVE